MGKRVYGALAVLAVALASMIVWRMSQPREPVYKGKPLTSWLKAFVLTYRSGTQNEHVRALNEAKEAVRQVGTNAIPTLLRLLREKDSPLKAKLMDLAEKQHLIKIRYTFAEGWNMIGEEGFEVLGTNAQSAMPALIQITDEHISRQSQWFAIRSLGSIGPPAQAAVPALLRWTTNANSGVRYTALISLGRIAAEPDRIVPLLTNTLHDPRLSDQGGALWALKLYGPKAKLAMPALVELLGREQDPGVRSLITNALEAIDPEAAAKAGIAPPVAGQTH